jgi:dGTPase
VLNLFVDDLIRNTQWRVVAARVQGADEVRSHPERLAGFSPEVEAQRRQNKEFLYENLYYSPSLADEKDDAERIIRDLFTFWMTHPESLPRSYREKAEEESLARVIFDYIAGMTDPFIFEQHEKHCG